MAACIVNPQGNQALPYSVSEAMQESDCAGQIALSVTMALVNVQGLNEWEYTGLKSRRVRALLDTVYTF